MKRYFRAGGDTDLGTGTFYYEFEGNEPLRQVDVYEDDGSYRYLWETPEDESFPGQVVCKSMGVKFMEDFANGLEDMGPFSCDEIKQKEFEDVWQIAKGSLNIFYASGDLFMNDDIKAFAHGCNCAGAMGAGIAVAFKKKWPAMYEEYKKLCKQGRFNPGDVFTWQEQGITIFNLGTQKHWRTKADLGAVMASMEKMLEEAARLNIKAIAMPQIGAGYGGLTWKEVDKVIHSLKYDHGSLNLIVINEFRAGNPYIY